MPPTQLALGKLASEAVADASGLFNMMRNLGGAIGIAAADTIIYSRFPEHARSLVDRLVSGNLSVANSLSMSTDALSTALRDPSSKAILAPIVHKVAFVQVVNDPWWCLAIIAFAAIVALPFAQRTSASDRDTFIGKGATAFCSVEHTKTTSTFAMRKLRH